MRPYGPLMIGRPSISGNVPTLAYSIVASGFVIFLIARFDGPGRMAEVA
jgi:hypothetical protein